MGHFSEKYSGAPAVVWFFSIGILGKGDVVSRSIVWEVLWFDRFGHTHTYIFTMYVPSFDVSDLNHTHTHLEHIVCLTV